MGLSKTQPQARAGRRVSLNRSGGTSSRNKNTRKEAKRSPAPGRQIRLPWNGIRQFFFTGSILSIILVFLVGVSFGLVYIYKSLVSGQYFALKTLEIQGNSRLSSREILETADLINGGNTLALSIDAVEEALSRHPWVEEVSVKRILPGTLIIGLREKNPVFWINHDGVLHYADATGTVIAPVAAGKFASLPTLEVEPGAEDTAGALPDLVRSLEASLLPVSLGSISTVRLSASRGVEVTLDDARLKLSVGLEEWVPNLRRLSRTLSDLQRRNELKDTAEIKAQGANVWVERRTRFTADKG